MSNIKSYLSEYDKNKNEALKVAEREATRMCRETENEIVADRFKGLESKELKLLEVVEALGDYINSDDSSDRIKCMYSIALCTSLVLTCLDSCVISGGRHQRCTSTGTFATAESVEHSPKYASIS